MVLWFFSILTETLSFFQEKSSKNFLIESGYFYRFAVLIFKVTLVVGVYFFLFIILFHQLFMIRPKYSTVIMTQI